jgi:hypothetical protein
MNDPRLLRLNPQDNVFVALQTIAAGDALEIGPCRTAVGQAIPIGFKIACHDLRTGEKIIKYGVPIGSTTRDIRAGEIVHLHNMKSDYLPTYTRQEGQKYGQA